MGNGASTGTEIDISDAQPEIIRPTIAIYADNIPEAYEQAMKRVWTEGASIRTQHDIRDPITHKYLNPPSRDAKVIIQVSNPFNQPRFHRAFKDGLGSLGEYVEEVTQGAHDYWMPSLDVRLAEARSKEGRVNTKWFYTYHERLKHYPGTSWEFIDQIENMAQNLAASSFTRRAQAITYVPWIDQLIDDPPCLQRVWARIFQGPDGKNYLYFDSDWRSRDLPGAWLENVAGITTLQRDLVWRVNEIRGEEDWVLVGPYTDHCNSLHIYGRDFEKVGGDPEKGVRSFFERMETKPFEDRTWDSKFVRHLFIDDGVGHGLQVMLEKEKGKMPEEVWMKVAADLERMKDPSYIV